VANDNLKNSSSFTFAKNSTYLSVIFFMVLVEEI
jgi:hypothetical protein